MRGTRFADLDVVISSRSVMAAQVRMVYEAVPRNELGGAIGAVLMWVIASYANERITFEARPSIWLFAVLLNLAIENRRVVPLLRAAPSDDVLLRSADVSIVTLVFGGAAWGSASWLMLPMQAHQEVCLMVFMAMVMMASSTAKLNFGPFRTHLLSMTAVFVLGLVRFGDAYHLWFALLYFVFVATILVSARDRETVVKRTIRISMLNELLLAHRNEEHHLALQAKAEAEAARAEAERANRAKSTFIAAASHDLRQPLHALVQYVEHLDRTNPEPQQRRTLQRIDESVEAMSDLLNAVLDFSKISLGSVRPEFEPLDIEEVMRGLETQLQPIASTAGLQLSFDFRGGLVRSDAALLERLLRNIVHNAIRYTPSGSIVVRAVPRGEIVRVLVGDSGIGIAADEKARIFEEYYQVENQARNRHKGLGLGLAIVRDLGALLAVRIRVKSLPGRGSTFAIEIPRADAQLSARRDAPASFEGDIVRGAAVLLIDDDELARDAMATTLRDLGCRVMLAESGQQAVAILTAAEFPPQLLLSDYRLFDGETGLDSIEQVLAAHRMLCMDVPAPPAILISGDTSPEVLARVAAAGFRIVHKPVRRKDLLAAMNEALGKAAVRAI